MKGRKRHLLVDTLGLIQSVAIQPGNLQERDGAIPLLAAAATGLPTWQKVWADQGYQGRLERWVEEHCPFSLEIVDKPARGRQQRGFHVLPKRWIVERTFAWLLRCRRLVRDYEYLPAVSEAVIYLAMIGLMLHRLAS